jgi:diaminohydroxyphosphoribosylaminopyrimidine deaminase/5-amino-6-(5-phosphoribosylamino)uracil reductase
VFAPADDYDRTIVLAPSGARERFANLREVADVVFVGAENESELNLRDAMAALRERGVQSVLCEGGPTLGARMITAGVVDRFYWAIAPVLLTAPNAVPVLAGTDLAALRRGLRFDRMEMVGRDVVLSGLFDV